ncbi:hypothetical protein BpHYR1_052172 [Brachionus plicatilis]|uniref:Uncharacterized protein n=1 Tax=Brachionus plicatilis TaxID=10195 RepID=A0A3M7QKV9_BRAPC|nr:hypothetical protein BpHYR1_052172 [Brachionus plicatilis]
MILGLKIFPQCIETNQSALTFSAVAKLLTKSFLYQCSLDGKKSILTGLESKIIDQKKTSKLAKMSMNPITFGGKQLHSLTQIKKFHIAKFYE